MGVNVAVLGLRSATLYYVLPETSHKLLHSRVCWYIGVLQKITFGLTDFHNHHITSAPLNLSAVWIYRSVSYCTALNKSATSTWMLVWGNVQTLIYSHIPSPYPTLPLSPHLPLHHYPHHLHDFNRRDNDYSAYTVFLCGPNRSWGRGLHPAS